MTVVRDTTTSHDITTDAGFRAWASAIATSLAAAGLVKTVETGEIDLGTVATPAGNSTFAGFQVYRFNDAAQSGDPIYFKIEYGRGGNAARPALRFTVGTGTDGAGTIANATTALSCITANTPSGSPELHICHVEGTLVLVDLALTTNMSLALMLVIERFRDETGAVITSGANKGWSALGQGVANLRKGGSNTNSAGCQPLGVGSAALPDARKRMGLVCVGDNNPGIGLVMAKSGEVASGDSGVMSVYGTNRTYKLLTAGAQTFTASAPLGGSVNYVFAALNE